MLFCQNITREKLREALSYKKHMHKMLMKLTPGVNFTYILWLAFLYKSVLHSFSLITVRLCNFCRKNIFPKAAYKMLMKLTASMSLTQCFFHRFGHFIASFLSSFFANFLLFKKIIRNQQLIQPLFSALKIVFFPVFWLLI